MRHLVRAKALVLLISLMTLWGGAVLAEEEGWKDTAEFSYVVTSGNAESETLGFKNTLTRKWENSAFELRAGGVRAEAENTVREYFFGGQFFEDTITETTAENYFLKGRYDRDITERFFWFAGAGWDRNRPAGINNRYQIVGGVGNIWVDNDTTKWKTNYGVTYTDQEDVVFNPLIDETFLGLQAGSNFEHKLTENATYGNDLVLDFNLDESDDWRADMINWLTVAMNDRLAIKLSVQHLFDNMPSFTEVAVATDATGGTLTGATIPRENEDLDTIFTASLVVNF